MTTDGNAISGDVSDQVDLWDAGSEVNQPIGEGDEQAPRQSGPNTGADEMGVVQLVSDLDDGLAYPATSDIVSVTLTAGDMGEFTVRIENVSGDSMFATPITPIAWLVESHEMMMDDEMMMSGAIFTSGHPDFGYGLESLAEDGNPATLAQVMGRGRLCHAAGAGRLGHSRRHDGRRRFLHDGRSRPRPRSWKHWLKMATRPFWLNRSMRYQPRRTSRARWRGRSRTGLPRQQLQLQL